MTAAERHRRYLVTLRARERRLWSQLVRVHWQRVLAEPYVVPFRGNGAYCGWCGRGLASTASLCPCLTAPPPPRRHRRSRRALIGRRS